MAYQSLTLQLPDSIYKRLIDFARRSDRPLNEATIDLLNLAVEEGSLPTQIEERLEQLTFLSDEELFHAARIQASQEDSDLMQGLLEKRDREGLTSSELEQVQALSTHFNQIMLVRAKSAVLLSERGHNISPLPIDQ